MFILKIKIIFINHLSHLKILNILKLLKLKNVYIFINNFRFNS